MKTPRPFLLLCALALAPGCVSGTGGPNPFARAPTTNPITVEGDFDDIDAVVAGVIPRFAMIEIPRPSEDPAVRRFDLKALDDSPGTLTFTQHPDGRIEIACTIGRFRDHERENALVRALASRLTRLRGDVAAPISER